MSASSIISAAASGVPLLSAVMSANAEYIGYSSPNNGALALMDEETRNDPISYPSTENTETFLNLPVATNELYTALWTEILKN